MGEKRPGCSLSEDSNRKGIELTGTTTSDIFIEKEGSKTSIAGISLAVSDKSYSFPNRQYNRPVLSCGGRGEGVTRNNYLIELGEKILVEIKYLLHYGLKLLKNIFQAPRTWQRIGS